MPEYLHADITLVQREVVLEIKAEKEYKKAHEAQLLNYRKATGVRVGLLIDFGRQKCQHRRLTM